MFIKQSSASIGHLLLGSSIAQGFSADNRTNYIMSNKRSNSFDVPHKGIRNGLSQLSLAASKANFGSKDEVMNLFNLGKEVFEILTTHANDENDVSLKALEQRVKGASHHDIEEHIRIHIAQSKLEALLEEIFQISKAAGDPSEKGREFYSGLSDFHAEYLRHMADEEKETQVLLWQHFTDEELAQHRKEIMKMLKPETLLLWFKFIIPAQSHNERVDLLSGFKAMAPNDFFQKAMSVVKSVLPPAEWNILNESLNNNE